MKVNLSHGVNSRGVNSKGCRTGTNHLMTMKGSVAEWSTHWTHNLVSWGSSLALATCWTSSRSSQVQILGKSCK